MGAAILPSVCADRPETDFGIPCFHEEFSVVRGAESGKEHSLPGSSWNARGEYSKERSLNRLSCRAGASMLALELHRRCEAHTLQMMSWHLARTLPAR